MEQKVHEGRNIKRFREMLGIKQEALAAELGEEWTQKKVSLLEARESVELNLLQRIAKAMNIPVDAFRSFDEEAAVSLISCTFSDHAMFNNKIEVFHNNPIEELRKLHDEKIALYERMLKEKDSMMEEMRKLIQVGRIEV